MSQSVSLQVVPNSIYLVDLGGVFFLLGGGGIFLQVAKSHKKTTHLHQLVTERTGPSVELITQVITSNSTNLIKMT